MLAILINTKSFDASARRHQSSRNRAAAARSACFQKNGLVATARQLSLDAVSVGIDLPGVRSFLTALSDVVDVHDLHVDVHRDAQHDRNGMNFAFMLRPYRGIEDNWSARMAQELHHNFLIGHSTIQLCADYTVPDASVEITP